MDPGARVTAFATPDGRRQAGRFMVPAGFRDRAGKTGAGNRPLCLWNFMDA